MIWLTAVVTQLIDYRRVYLPVSDINIPPLNWRLDNAGILAFALSAIGFFLWQLGKEES
jgi:hypothetical protein